MTKRILVAVGLVLLLMLLGRELFFRFSSDEDKILRALEEIADSFSSEDNAGVMYALTVGWIIDQLKDSECREAWRIGSDLEMQGQDGTWLLHRIWHETLSGKSPF
ncbi:MAG: hypothetical protein V3W41_03935 [Planctomycetota bacterium]